MRSHCWSQTVGSLVVLQSYHMALSPVHFSPMSPPQFGNLTMCPQQNLFPFSPILTLFLQESPQKKSCAYFFPLLCQVITSPLVAAGWIADHSKMAAFTDWWPQGSMHDNVVITFSHTQNCIFPLLWLSIWFIVYAVCCVYIWSLYVNSSLEMWIHCLVLQNRIFRCYVLVFVQ
jgi:hypothetical protein